MLPGSLSPDRQTQVLLPFGWAHHLLSGFPQKWATQHIPLLLSPAMEHRPGQGLARKAIKREFWAVSRESELSHLFYTGQIPPSILRVGSTLWPCLNKSLKGGGIPKAVHVS